jgi:mycothiol synthase
VTRPVLLKWDVRPFVPSDYAGMVAIWNALNPDRTRSAADERDTDERREPIYAHGRFVAELGGTIVGVAEYGQNPGRYHPRRFELEGYVAREHQGRGIGRALYDRALAALTPQDPLSVRASVGEDSARGLRFLQARGFAELKRDFTSVLDVATADLSPFAGLDEALACDGITITSFAELLEADPRAAEKLHALFSEVRLDIPRSDAPTPISFSFFSDNLLRGPDYDPAAFFVARAGTTWAGFSAVYRVGATSDLDQWLTGVRRPFRRRGLALSLKVRTVRYAHSHGFARIRTDNDSRNTAMIAVNDKLGFRRGPEIITMRKDFPPATRGPELHSADGR